MADPMPEATDPYRWTVDALPRTRKQTISRLKALGLQTYADMLLYAPFRFEDYRQILSIGTIQDGSTGTIHGTVESIEEPRTRSRMKMIKLMVRDRSGLIGVTWFNQPYIKNLFPTGSSIAVAGSARFIGRYLVFEPKEYEPIKPDTPLIHTGKLVPVYSTTYGLSSRVIREKIEYVLNWLLTDGDPKLLDAVPEQISSAYDLEPITTAVTNLHRPEKPEDHSKARARFGFSELFILQLGSLLVRREWEQEKATAALPLSEDDRSTMVRRLPFELTNAQKRATDQILADMAQTRPMNRFLQGDVGSGKTAVAAIATFASYQNGFQTILMAPTEILATQHFTTCSRLLEPHGISVGLHTRTNRIKDPQSYDMIVGTHAVLTEKLQFERVGLVVIDEQHRFGVAQRAQLRAKGASPHLLTMTATPIPRTVSLTIYGELDMSVLDELPAGRKPIKTSIIPETKRPKAYEWIQQQIHDHSTQVFVIYPLIEESSSETMKSVKAATKEYEALQKQFGKIPIALLHGKLPAKEKDRIMKAFADGEYAILVSTSVVEVGIDVPNASIMIIEGAERFGLAQLHQLRGRVGRGERQSYCFLFTSADANPYNQRLRQFCTTSSGIELAEYDLQNRGSGELYGTRQSGEDMLQFAQLTDLPLIQQTRQAAESFLTTDQLDRYPNLRRQLEQLQMHRIAQD